MPTKYIIEGATYCGDGTASNEAASAGAAGAWNSIGIVKGDAPAYGTAIAAGDVINIRSKTSAGADISIPFTAATLLLGSTAATAAAPVHWVLDDGTIWSGVNGVLKYYAGSGAYTISFRANNVFVANTPGNWQVQRTEASCATSTGAQVYGHVKGVKFDFAARTSGSAPTIYLYDGAIVEDATVLVGAMWNNNLFAVVQYGAPVRAWIINPTITVDSAHASGSGVVGGYGMYAGLHAQVIGGKLQGSATNSALMAVAMMSSGGNIEHVQIDTVGFQVPLTVTPVLGTVAHLSHLYAFGLDADLGAHLEERWGWATSRKDNNPPTLSAQLPLSSTPAWAWRVYPKAATAVMPAKLVQTKAFTDSAGTKTITLEALVANTYGLDKSNAWITVEYVDDATGAIKHLSTKAPAGGSLDSSTAGWSATTWGVVTCDKKKFSVTTPTSVKQDSPITVTFWCTKQAPTANDILFVDSDFSVT